MIDNVKYTICDRDLSIESIGRAILDCGDAEFILRPRAADKLWTYCRHNHQLCLISGGSYIHLWLLKSGILFHINREISLAALTLAVTHWIEGEVRRRHKAAKRKGKRNA